MRTVLAPRPARRGRRAVALVAVGLLATLGATACEPARTPAKDRVVLMVHGYSAFGNGVNCNSSFGTLTSSLRSRASPATWSPSASTTATPTAA